MQFMIKRDQFVAPIKTNCFAASFSAFTDYTTRRTNGDGIREVLQEPES